MTSTQDGSAQGQASGLTASVQSLSDTATEVRIIGPLDLLTAPEMASAISTAMTSAAAGSTEGSGRASSVLLIDLQGVDFLGSAGLSVLVDAEKRADRDGVLLALVATGHPVLHALQVTGLDQVLRVYPDRQAALAAAGDGAPS